MQPENELLVDALPYFDEVGDKLPGQKQSAKELIEQEMKRHKPSSKNYLDFLGSADYHLFETPLLNAEIARISNRTPMEAIDMRRYELLGPSMDTVGEPESWRDAVLNSRAQLQHQMLRLSNLEEMVRCAVPGWRQFVCRLERLTAEAKARLERERKAVYEVNLKRRSEQLEAGQELSLLDDQWASLVSKNYEIECSIATLERELEDFSGAVKNNHCNNSEKIDQE